MMDTGCCEVSKDGYEVLEDEYETLKDSLFEGLIGGGHT